MSAQAERAQDFPVTKGAKRVSIQSFPTKARSKHTLELSTDTNCKV